MRPTQVVAAASVVALSACSFSKPPADLAAARAAMNAIDRSLERFVAAGAVDSIVALYAPEASLIAANAPPNKGTEAIRKMWSGYAAMGLLREQLHEGDFVLDDSLLVYRGTGAYEIRAKPPADTNKILVSERGDFVATLVRRDGTWLILYDSFVTEPPQPAPAAARAENKK
jgi:ketosteroid isomerase-like protein